MKRTNQYDLEHRTSQFAKATRKFLRRLPVTIANTEDSRQLIRSSGSVGANYLEANDSLSKKDFIMRIKICRKEAKESRYWLDLLDLPAKTDLESLRCELLQESTELMKIFGAILHNSQNRSSKY